MILKLRLISGNLRSSSSQDRSSGGRESKHLSASRPSLGSSLLAGFNTVMRAILVPNQIAPRVAAECFR